MKFGLRCSLQTLMLILSCAISTRWDRPHPTDGNLHVIVFTLISNNICVTVLICTLVFYVWNVSAAKLRYGRCQPQAWQRQTLVDSGLAAARLGFGSCQTNSGLAAAKLGFSNCQTRVWQLPNSGLAAAKLWFTRVWQLPNSGKCQTRVLVMKSFLRWCYCVHILATFHFVLCWFCLVLFCSILSKRFQLCCSVPI